MPLLSASQACHVHSAPQRTSYPRVPSPSAPQSPTGWLSLSRDGWLVSIVLSLFISSSVLLPEAPMLPCLTMRQKAAVSHKVLGEQGHLPSPGLWASCLWPEVTAGLFQPLTSEAALKQQSVAQTPQSFLPCGVVCGMCGRSAQPCRLSLVTGQFLPATTVAVISFCLALHWVIYTLPPTLGCRPSHQSSVFPLPQLLAWLLWVQTGLLGRQRCPEGGWEAGDPS